MLDLFQQNPSVDCDSGTPENSPKPVQKSFIDAARALLARAGIVAIADNHNQFLDAFGLAKKRGHIPEGPLTMVHLDTHSDIWANTACRGHSIGNFINHLMKHDGVREIYWVLPDATRLGMYENKFWNFKSYLGICTVLADAPDTIVAYRRKHKSLLTNISLTGLMNWLLDFDGDLPFEVYWRNIWGELKQRQPYQVMMNPEAFEKITIRKITHEQLPDFSGKKVLLSIDGDYFQNGGYDTCAHLCFPFDRTHAERVITGLVEKNIDPALAFFCLSPQYSVEKRKSPNCNNPVLKFLYDITEGRNDVVGGDHHPALHTRTSDKKPFTGRTYFRDQPEDLTFAYVAKVLATSNLACRTLPLKSADSAAQDVVKQLVTGLSQEFKCSAGQATDYLSRLAAYSGHPDQINVVSIDHKYVWKRVFSPTHRLPTIEKT